MLKTAFSKLFGGGPASTAEPAGAAKRRHTRVQPAPGKPVDVQIMGENFLETARARDISLGGLAAYIPHGLAADAFGSAVNLIIKLPGRSAFDARGIVRHASKSQDGRFIGIEFTALDDRARLALEQYIESRSGETPP